MDPRFRDQSVGLPADRPAPEAVERDEPSEDGSTSGEPVSTSGEKPTSKEDSASSSIVGALVGGGAAFLTAFSILVALGWVAWTVVSDHAAAAHRAVAWNEVEGVVTYSAVDAGAVGSSRGSSRSARGLGRKARIFLHRSRLELVAEYQVGGVKLEATTLGGYGQPFAWRPTPAQLAARLPMGSRVNIRVDPGNPGRAVVEPGMAGWRLLELLVVIPIVAMAALLLRAAMVRRALRRDPLGQRLRVVTGGQVRLRMTASSPWTWGLVGVAVGAVQTIVATLALVGREPAVSDVALAAIGAFAIGALAAAFCAWWLGRGGEDLVVDDVRDVLVLPAAARARRAATGEGDDERSENRMRRMLEERTDDDAVRCDRIESIDAVEPTNGKGWQLRITLRDARSGARSRARLADRQSPIDLPGDSCGALWVPAAAEWLRQNVVTRNGSRPR